MAVVLGSRGYRAGRAAWPYGPDRGDAGCACASYKRGAYDELADRYLSRAARVGQAWAIRDVEGPRAAPARDAVVEECLSEIGRLRKRNGELLYEKMVRDNRRAIRLLDRVFNLGPTDGAELESIEGMLEGRMDPGETSLDLVRDARDRF